MTAPKPATSFTREANLAAAASLSFDDPTDFAAASRGLIATLPDGRVLAGDHVVWDVARHDFLRESEAAPDTVHPGLWRQGRLNAVHGLFEVVDGVWQARGYDISNLTFIAGRTGWILVDVLTTAATASACLALANETLGERPVRAVIYTHSHADHFGGILGVTTRQAVADGDVHVIAPEGFLREVVSENVIAGGAMFRRAQYQFGPLLPPGPRGHVDCGLGKAVPFAPSALVAPTEEVAVTGTERVVDGVRIVFQNTPDTEAPAEMNFHFPDLRLLCMAENCTHNLHNLYPIRGAPTRDALAWSKFIDEAIELWADDTDVMFATHHWPRFGRDDVRVFLELQRDVYRWMHDQTLRLANMGWTPVEIAEELTLPEAFAGHSHVRGYYGTVSHNVKSIYNRYLGWYDANPAHLQPLPAAEASPRYVELMGGPDEVLRRARQAFDAGEYRWVAEVVNHVVFADPANTAARGLQADALEQLGYQAESGTWRNAYLMGAQELRTGSPHGRAGRGRQIADAMTVEQLFDSVGVRFDPQAFDVGPVSFNWLFTDVDERHVLGIAHAAIHHLAGRHDPEGRATVTGTRADVLDVLAGAVDLSETELVVEGDVELFEDFLDALTSPTVFPLVEPR